MIDLNENYIIVDGLEFKHYYDRHLFHIKDLDIDVVVLNLEDLKYVKQALEDEEFREAYTKYVKKFEIGAYYYPKLYGKIIENWKRIAEDEKYRKQIIKKMYSAIGISEILKQYWDKNKIYNELLEAEFIKIEQEDFIGINEFYIKFFINHFGDKDPYVVIFDKRADKLMIINLTNMKGKIYSIETKLELRKYVELAKKGKYLEVYKSLKLYKNFDPELDYSKYIIKPVILKALDKLKDDHLKKKILVKML